MMALRTRLRIFSLLSIRNLCSYHCDKIKVTKIGKVTCMGINRPQNKNSLNVETLTQLKHVLGNFENDNSTFAGVIYGEQGNFSHGYDQNEINNAIEIIESLNAITEKFSKKPLVAALSGFAVGPAFDLALWCDFRIVEDTAIMSAHARSFGVPLSEQAAKRMISLIGIHRTLDLIVTGRIVKAKEAFECGIATRIVACGTGLGQAVNFANSLCNMPQACLKADRATIFSATDCYAQEIVKTIISDEKIENYKIALREVENKVHETKSGDVRRKDLPAGSSINQY